MSYIGNVPISAAFLTDTFSGTGSQVAYTMTVAPANTSSIIVAVTGVLQDPSTYSVSGTTLTFSAAPPTGTSNISVRYLGIPASGVTTTAYRTVTNFTATAGQTSFSVPSYTVGYIDVYRNGVRLVNNGTDFVATTGTTVVLNNACTVGDSVVTESFLVSSVLNAIPATAGSVSASYLVSGSITPSYLAQPFTSGTAVATTSGTSIDFTGIPSWVKRVTVVLNGVSTSGSSNWILQLGSGSVTSTGYLGCGARFTNGSGVTIAAYTSGIGINIDNAAAVLGGAFTATLLGSNKWSITGLFSRPASDSIFNAIGTIDLAGVLDRVRLTTVNGTDAFDAGSINILYE